LVVSACGTRTGPSPVRHVTGILVTAERIGSLRIDVSTQADVRAFAGRRGAALIHDKTSWPGVPSYTAYGYGCPRATGPGSIYPTVQGCRTVYYINNRTHRFVAFYTDSPRFHTVSGIRPGMPRSDAVVREHSTPGGPLAAIVRRSKQSTLAIEFDCSHPGPGCGLDHVSSLGIESRQQPIGLLYT
jgi:hypothetical protein